MPHPVDEGRIVGPSDRANTRVHRAPHRRVGASAWLVFPLLMASVVLSGPAGGLPSPGSSVGVATGAGDARTPSLAVDATGLMHLAWADDVTGERGVHYARSFDGGASWTPSVRIDTPGNASYAPRIAVERESVGIRGRLYVAYQRGAGASADVWLAVSDGGAFWSLPRQVDSAPAGVTSSAPAVAASDLRVHVAWQDTRNGYLQIFVRTSSDGSGTWGPEIQVSPGGIVQSLQARADAKGDVAVVVWRQDDGATFSIGSARTEDGGATWRSSIVAFVPRLVETVQEPEVFVDELGAAHVVWVHRTGAGDRVNYAWSSDGVAWSPPEPVDDIPGLAAVGTPSISGVAGTLWAAWHDARNGDSDVHAAWSTDGITWGDGIADGLDLRVDDTDRTATPSDDATLQTGVTLRTGGYGVYVAWEDSRGGAALDVYFGAVTVSPLLITEVQDEPSSEARVEVYNFGRTPFSLAGVSLVAGGTTVDLSPLGSIGARAHVAIGAAVGSDLVVPLDMGSDGSRIRILGGGDVLAAAGTGMFGVAPDPLPGESSARFAGSLDYTAEWTRAPGASFRARNTVVPPDLSPDLLLNEVLFYPANPGDRFVELHVRGSVVVDLTGYRVVSDAVYTIPGGYVDPSNPRVLLLEARTPAWFASLNAVGDNAYLYDPSGRLIDMVGWSTPHAIGMSVSRTTPGVGGSRGYDEPTDVANGWAFGQDPSLALVLLEADQRVMADIGTTAQFVLTATNLQADPEYLNVEASAVLSNWPIRLLALNGTVLLDSAGDADGIPDVGLVDPGASASFVVEVRVPMEPPLGDGNTITVSASAASIPVGRDDATLWIDLYPHFDVTRTVSPSPVYLEGSGPGFNEITQITLTVEGAGLPVVQQIPIDVVFQTDESGSMNSNDATNLRVEAVKAFVDGMRIDDRGVMVGFTDVPWVVNNRPLTFTDAGGKIILKSDADTLACSPGCSGWTNIESAIQLGNDVLIAQGNRSRPRIEILLTDGFCAPSPCSNMNIISQAASEGIIIYTIGLGSSVDTAYLQTIAAMTGGRYFLAATAQDLRQIYDEIGQRINRTAGSDPNVSDNVPMMEEQLAPYLTLIPNTFYDPLSGMPRPPAFVQQQADRTRIQWNVSSILINESWSVRFSVTSTRLGVQDVALHPDARVAYMRWDGSSVSQPIPQGTLEVMRAVTPPHIIVTNPPDGATSVDLAQPISVVFDADMNTATVQWTISPPVSATLSWIGRVLTLTHAGLAECTVYTVEVTQARDLQGEDLEPGPVPNPWSFTTVCPAYVQYTITRFPLVGDVTVDGVSYAVPHTFRWQVGTDHRLVAPDLEPLGASRLAFAAWDDGGARDHTLTVGDADRTIIAGYDWQHRVDLTFVGLQVAYPSGVRYTLYQSASSASSSSIWSEFADEGSDVDVDRQIPGNVGERFITEDETAWLVKGPLTRVVTYHHQFTALVRTIGLDGNEVGVDFTALARASRGSLVGSWTAWVDAGRPVRVDDALSIGPRERYRTLETTQWTVDAPLDVTVAYLHQFLPQVTLIGLDGNHTVGTVWVYDVETRAVAGLVVIWSEWADAGTALTFDAESTGVPPRTARTTPAFVVDSPFDETIVYEAPPPPPPPTREVVTPGNWKPVLAIAYTLLILAGGAAGSRRLVDRFVPGRGDDRRLRKVRWAKLSLGEKFNEMSVAGVEEKVYRDRRFTRLLLMVPFAAAEAAIGLTSYATGALRIPEGDSWLPAGFWVNTAVLVAAVAMAIVVWRQGYRMTEDDLLRMAAVRERSEATEA